MEREHSGHKSLEELMSEKEEVSRQIMDLDAKGKTGKELDKLHKRHEELTQKIEEMPNQDELHKAA